MACLFGHKWDGCTCTKCGKIRDEGHDWDGCTCKRCGRIRDNGHDWDLCKGKCKRCGKTQPEQHDWDGCTCKRCGRIRDNGHDWDGCKCRRCRKTRDEGHDLDLCKGKCKRCGKRQPEQHDWNGATCSRCAKHLSLKDLHALTDQQPTWFSHKGHCNNRNGIAGDVIAECDYEIKTDSKGYIVDETWHPCKCPSCGFAVHMGLQPDFTCETCHTKVSTLDAICTINALGDQVKYDRSYLQRVIQLSSRLPAALAKSVEEGKTLDVHAADYYFNNNSSTRDTFGKLIGMDYYEYIRVDKRTLTEQDKRLHASDIENLYTRIMQNCIQVWSNEKPEKNYFA